MMSAVPAFADTTSNQGGGVMNFEGSVMDAPCSVDAQSQALQVKLGDWSTKKLYKAGEHSEPTLVTINLTGCQFDPDGVPLTGQTQQYLFSKVAITFPDFAGNGSQDLKNGKIQNTAPDAAKNVVIQLLKGDGSTGVDLTQSGNTVDKIQLDGSSKANKLQFYAQILATGAAEVGGVGAQLAYKLNYF
ncbi:fimbrial protein [Salmonella enterica]|nr:fimbrial protein [Salmonella enterica]EKB5476530.1 fimbrial protein [Salmonella enterica]ELL0515352.1 fimbrial protein [Salmonella enterica]